jgi:type III secretion protein J
MRAADGKILGAVLLALTVASVGGCSTAILHGLEEPSANETVAALERVGIGAEKQPDDDSNNGGGALAFKVRVARADEARALEQLRSPSLIPTASEERARYLDALAGEVARTLEIADGVVRARVHLVPEEIDPLAGDGRARTPARAAVLIKARGGKIPLGEADIKKLVAGSVPGLDPAAVAVVVTAAADPAAAAGEQWSSLGPLRLAPGSRALLIAALVVGLGLLGAMAALLLLTLRRQTAPEPPAGR